MKDLVTAKPLTMSSKEIADLVEKRHDNVKRTIITLVNQGVITSPQIEETSFIGADGKKQWAKGYLLEKRDTYVVVAQLSPQFTARLVDRWQELEEAAKKPAFQLPDFTNPSEAARAWADQFDGRALAEKKVAQLTAENKVMYDELHLVTIDEWRALNHLYLTHGEKIKLGKMATKLCFERGIEIEKQARKLERYGKIIETSINVYPRGILDEAHSWKSPETLAYIESLTAH